MRASLFYGLLVVIATLVAGLTHAGENMLKGTEISTENNWVVFISKLSSGAGSLGSIENNTATLKAVGKNPADHIQLYCKDVDLEADKAYSFKFKLSSTQQGKLDIAYCLSKEPWTRYARVSVDVEVGEKEYTITLSPQKAADGSYDTPRSLRIFFGNFDDASFTVSEVALTAQ